MKKALNSSAKNSDDSADKFPLSVTFKGATVMIYESPLVQGGRTYPSYMLSWTANGKRCRKRISDLSMAKGSARGIAEQLAEGTAHAHTLTPAQVADFTAAERMLRQMPGFSLVEAVAGFVRASSMLPAGHSLETAAARYAASVTAAAKLSDASVAEVVSAFVASREKNGSSDRYLRDMRLRLTKFAGAFKTPIASVTAADITAWLDGLKVGGRSRWNYRNAIVTLFAFAQRRGNLPRETKTEAEMVERPRPTSSKIGIYTPEELRRMLGGLPDYLLAATAIQAFAGLRTAEVFRLEWREIDLVRGHIEVAAEKAKTASRRLVPIVPALADWLAKCPRGEGRLLTFSHETAFNRSVARALKRAGVPRVANGLRHSFASYRLAAVKSAEQVALEMGNSPRKLFTNYRELVTESDAAAWFNVLPKLPKNVRRMPRQKAA